MESGGTVLSTNWAEIGKEKVSLKFGDGERPNLCRVKKKVDVNSTYIENIIRSGLTLNSWDCFCHKDLKQD